MNVEITLPDRPCIRDGVDVVPLLDGSVLVRGHRGSVALSGSFVTQAMPGLITRLDGRTDVAALIEGVDATFKEEAESFLRLMHDRRYLVPGSSDQNLNADETDYWSLHAADPAAALDRLASARLLVLGNSEAAEACGSGLRDAGVRRMSFASRTALTKESLLELANGVSTMVLAGDGMSLAGVDVVNQVALERGIPWLLLRIDRTHALIGPHVLPGETACFSCYELRARANAARPDEHAALHKHWRDIPARSSDLSTPPGAASLVGRWAAQDLARSLASQRPAATVGCIIVLDLHTLESTRREILRLPRCPACSRLRDRPMTRIWDIPTNRVAPDDV